MPKMSQNQSYKKREFVVKNELKPNTHNISDTMLLVKVR